VVLNPLQQHPAYLILLRILRKEKKLHPPKTLQLLAEFRTARPVLIDLVHIIHHIRYNYLVYDQP
jgi:hypothetical protein